MEQLFDLQDWTTFRDHFDALVLSIWSHHCQTEQELRKLGAVVPSKRFWQQEHSRYVDIFGRHSAVVAPIRELLQNSSDSGCSYVHLDVCSISHSSDQILHQMEAVADFVYFADDGRWCEQGSQETTYERCCNRFLYMNGSSKSTTNDGGFGVGRFVILFCSPMWFFTVKNIMVMGHYGSYQVLCRRCLADLVSPLCGKCGLIEDECPDGTTFLIHYPFVLAQHFPLFLKTIHHRFLRYALTHFEIHVESVHLLPVSTEREIFNCNWFRVFKLNERYQKALYVIRTFKGVPMFSVSLRNVNSEKGVFIVELVEMVHCQHFDQARQTLVGEPGLALRQFLSERDGCLVSFDISRDFLVDVKGLCPFEMLGIQFSNQAETDVAKRVEQGLFACRYLFRNDMTMDNIPELWKPQSRSFEQVYILLLWISCLVLVRPHNRAFRVGFVFEKKTKAFILQDTFFINPLLLVDVSDKQQRYALLGDLSASALHEHTHYDNDSSNHDDTFAATISDLTSLFLEKQLHKRQLLRIDNRCHRLAKKLTAREYS